MGIINEASAIQQNKNMFNKVIGMAKRYENRAKVEKDVTFRLNDDILGGPSFTIKFKFVIDGYDLIQEQDWVYICAKVHLEPSRVWYGWRNSSVDPAYEFINSCLKFEKGSWQAPSSNLIDAVVADTGLHTNHEYSQQEIAKTEAYKRLTNALSEIQSVTYNTELRKEVHKRLKTRTNVVPLAFFRTEDGDLNVPTDYLPYGKPMATACRTDYSLSGILKNAKSIGEYMMRYTPFDKWTIADFSKVGNYVDVRHAEITQS
jgi:hypothetical protein